MLLETSTRAVLVGVLVLKLYGRCCGEGWGKQLSVALLVGLETKMSNPRGMRRVLEIIVFLY